MILKNVDCPHCGESLSNYAVIMDYNWECTILPAGELRLIMDQEQARLASLKKTALVKNNTRAGYIYVLGSNEGFYKIGLTKREPDERILEFSPALPFKTHLEVTIWSEDMYVLEKELHRVFKNKKTNGEWFKLSENDLDYIRKTPWTFSQNS